MDIKLINLAYELSDEIKNSNEYQKLIKLKKIIDTDQDIKTLISDFNKIKIKYEEVRKYGKYHPNLKDVQLQLQAIKEQVFEHPVIKEYKQLEKHLQKVLDQVSKEIATSVSNNIKHPNEVGLLPKH